MEIGKKESASGQREERRGFARLPCSRFACSCSVKPDSRSGATGDIERRGALLSDISPEGISFKTNFQPPAKEYMHFEVRPIEGPEVMAKIEVLYSRRSVRSGFYIVGSRFKEISEHDRQNLLVLLDTISRMEHDLSNPQPPPR